MCSCIAALSFIKKYPPPKKKITMYFKKKSHPFKKSSMLMTLLVTDGMEHVKRSKKMNLTNN